MQRDAWWYSNEEKVRIINFENKKKKKKKKPKNRERGPVGG